MLKRLVEAENPRKPLSDARLAENLKAAGVPVARRTVAKYRELLNIPSSHERVRIACVPRGAQPEPSRRRHAGLTCFYPLHAPFGRCWGHRHDPPGNPDRKRTR